MSTQPHLAAHHESDPILEVAHVSHRFGNFQALNDVSVRFDRAQLTAIIGPNGAGKSTFFNVVSGAFAPTSGRIRFQGRDITGLAPHEYARIGIAKSFQITNVFKQLSVHENVRVAAQMRTARFALLRPRGELRALIDRADALLARVGLTPSRDKAAGDLAHGQQRALEVAMALAAEPILLLMDEPTAGMSPQETTVMMDLITSLATERTVILVEHKMKLVMNLCQRLIVLHHGELLAEGTPDEIRNNAEVRRVYLGRTEIDPIITAQSTPPAAASAASVAAATSATPATSIAAPVPMLLVTGLNAYYERSHVVQGIDFSVLPGEIVTLMGRNGAGKTTTLRAIMGLVGRRSGSVQFNGQECLPGPAHSRYHLGLAYVPEDRRIVPGLTVRENLQLGLIAGAARGSMVQMLDEIATIFPRLKERLDQEATSMSGGEQQMLAIARAMMARPKMILLDEPSEGIMPILVDEMFELFARMKQSGTSILLVEQNVERALSISDRAYILDQGRIVYSGLATDLLTDLESQEKYCAV